MHTADANGNVGQLVDAVDGTIATHYEYDPFGNLLLATGPEIENNPFRFSTKYFIPEIAWYDYGRRYYAPKLGRWPTRDPIGEEGELNLYGFVGNNGINFVDPLGLYVYFAIYYNKGTSFKRAAETWEREIKNRALWYFP